MSPSERGFSIIDLLASIAILGILAMLVVPQLWMAFDRGRQRRSMGEMRNLSTALATFQVDGGNFPLALATLVPDYYAAAPSDGWQQPFLYIGVGGGCSYILISIGNDTAFGPNPPDPWLGDVFEPDIWLVNGTFLQAPGLADETSQLGAVLTAACS